MKGQEIKGALAGMSVATYKNIERWVTHGVDWNQATEWGEAIVLSVICTSVGYFVTRFWKRRFPVNREVKP